MGLLWKGTQSHKKLHIRSGGEIDVKSGASFKLAGVAITQGAAVANGATSCTNPVTQAEGEAIQAKTNAILAALRAANIIAT